MLAPHSGRWALTAGAIVVIVGVVVAMLIGVGPQPVAGAACGSTTAPCDARQRLAAADHYLAGRPGTVGYVWRDRVTGARYANPQAGVPIWTASTIKLAMVADLLTREQAGAVRLEPADRQRMVDMLRRSDNDAADALWTRYESGSLNANAARYGMPGLAAQPGYGSTFPYWGFQKSTAADLDGLMTYVLTGLTPANAAAVTAEMQRVDGDQRWGVFGAGPAMAPGAKNGWSQEDGGWVVNSVGFAGPGQRFTLAVMNSLGGEGDYEDGVETTTQLGRILLAP